MKKTAQKIISRRKRKARIRRKVRSTARRPRLSVFRSLANITVQLIDDDRGVTLGTISTGPARFQEKHPGSGANRQAAETLGEMTAELARDLKIEAVVFDRSGYKYHGRLQALAEAARKAGLKL
jgi:large subunit ribosomal protein L18